MLMLEFSKEQDVVAPGVLVRGRWVCSIVSVRGATGYGQTREEAAANAVRLAFEVMGDTDPGVV